MKNIAVKLPEELLARLDAASKRQAAGRSGVVRKALREYLESGAAAGSFAEQAARSGGCFQGPRDLSRGARHMKGYGR